MGAQNQPQTSPKPAQNQPQTSPKPAQNQAQKRAPTREPPTPKPGSYINSTRKGNSVGS